MTRWAVKLHRSFDGNTTLYVIIGCTAGMSAAFNVPVGGILFAMEEFLDIHSNPLACAFITIACVPIICIYLHFCAEFGPTIL